MIPPVVTVETDAWLEADVHTLARLAHEDGAPVLQADVSTVRLRLYDLDSEGGFREPLANDANLTVPDVLFDTFQLDAWWSAAGAPDDIGYNFRHALLKPWETYGLVVGHRLRLVYEIARTGGRSPLWLRHDRTLLPSAG